jgi:hypothetical protein
MSTIELNVLLIHPETICSFVLAADSIAFNSLGVTRTRKNPALALPLGNGGRPAFLAFGFRLKVPKLLYNGRSDSEYW